MQLLDQSKVLYIKYTKIYRICIIFTVNENVKLMSGKF